VLFFKSSSQPTPGELFPKDVAGLGIVSLLLSNPSSQRESGFHPGQWPCASEAHGAGDTPENACLHNADARP
jgi:hypothetical protein